MAYTADQIGPCEIREVGTRTKDRYVLVLIQHGDQPGIDETQVSILSPCGWRAGRHRTLELVSRGIDLQDIRVAEIPEGWSGTAGAAEGEPLHPATWPLWWTVLDDWGSRKEGSREAWAAKRAKRMEARR